MFTMMPTLLEVAFTIGVIGLIYETKYFVLNLATIVMYFVVTIVCTEWRAKFFKKQSQMDATYV